MISLLPILEPLTGLLSSILSSIHDQLPGHSWAWSIIILTVLVRIAILPVTIKQQTSMMRMQTLQPYLKQLQERYKDDKQELQVKMMEFYRTNKVNPFASCLPILLQIPIFIGLFYTLKDYDFPPDSNLSFLFGLVPDITETIKEAGAVGWALLIFYVGSQMVASWVMSANTPNPQQRKLFLIMPLFIAPFIRGFPIGVMLYWITTNLWTLGQYKFVTTFMKPAAKEIVLPEDSKGNQRVIKPKGQGSKGSSSKSKQGADASSSDVPPPAPRPNKRRR